MFWMLSHTINVSGLTNENEMLSLDELKNYLSYDPDTGIFVRSSLSSWNAKSGTLSNGYVRISVRGKIHAAHRLAWLYMTGYWPNHEIDHINMDKSDNRWCNLREATRSENCHNQSKRSRNTSGYKGVSWDRLTGKWRASISVNGKEVYVGIFMYKHDAHTAYCNASIELHKQFGRI